MNQTKFFSTAQRVIEFILLLFIYIGNLYPHINYKGVKIISELLFFAIFLFFGTIYFLLRRFTKIKVASEDNINLLVAASLFIVAVFLLIFMAQIVYFISTGQIPPSKDPRPAGFLETVGYFCAMPSLLGATLLPFLNLISYLRKPNLPNTISFCIIALTVFVDLITKSQFVLIVGFSLSYLSRSIFKDKSYL